MKKINFSYISVKILNVVFLSEVRGEGTDSRTGS